MALTNASVTASEKNLLEVSGLSIAFRASHGWERVVDDVAFEIPRGGTLALVGESGSGKTVCSLAVMGLIRAPAGRVETGEVWLNGRDLEKFSKRERRASRGRDVAMIFQEPRRSLDPAFTVGDQIAESARVHLRVSRSEAWELAIKMLDRVGIVDARRRAREYPHNFSGGMCQRVMIAMALISNPKLLIADEPTTALDVTIQAEVIDLLRDLQADLGLSLLFITHDLSIVAQVCDAIAVMYAGQVVENGPVLDVFREPHHPYTRALLGAIPQVSLERGRLLSIPGRVPLPAEWPAGCRFESRCDFAIDNCREPVALRAIEPGRDARCIRSEELQLLGAVGAR